RWFLGDALAASGDLAGAQVQYELVRRQGPREDPRMTAHFLAAHDREPAQAVALAREELARRDDVFSADVLSFALYRAGMLDEAHRMSERALRLGTRDARMLHHAALIAEARGETDRAIELYRACLDANPIFDREDA